MLTISVKNFGPIAEGSVDLKPLTIFVGPNNTGKSYMATAAYALLRVFVQPLPQCGDADLALALDAELRRLFGPAGDLARKGERVNTLRIGLTRPGIDSSASYELSGQSLTLRREAGEKALRRLTDVLPPVCHYLPASRSWIVCAGKSAPPPGTGADFAGHWRQLMTGKLLPAPATEGIGRVAEFLEGTILLGGVIEVHKPGDTAPVDGLSLPLRQTSSMVSELAPLILFLKYLVRPGDLLIVEEPESHLHPAAQRQLARGIVRLVNAGVRVLITTHSDIMVSQINNLLALRQASPELVEQGGFAPEDFLEPEQVGAYLFRYSQELGGCETVPLDIDEDTGIDEDEFAAVFEAIYNESIALQRDRN